MNCSPANSQRASTRPIVSIACSLIRISHFSVVDAAAADSQLGGADVARRYFHSTAGSARNFRAEDANAVAYRRTARRKGRVACRAFERFTRPCRQLSRCQSPASDRWNVVDHRQFERENRRHASDVAVRHWATLLDRAQVRVPVIVDDPFQLPLVIPCAFYPRAEAFE